ADAWRRADRVRAGGERSGSLGDRARDTWRGTGRTVGFYRFGGSKGSKGARSRVRRVRGFRTGASGRAWAKSRGYEEYRVAAVRRPVQCRLLACAQTVRRPTSGEPSNLRTLEREPFDPPTPSTPSTLLKPCPRRGEP